MCGQRVVAAVGWEVVGCCGVGCGVVATPIGWWLAGGLVGWAVGLRWVVGWLSWLGSWFVWGCGLVELVGGVG